MPRLKVEKRIVFAWDHLEELKNVIDVSWCLVGNFNELATPNEKNGGKILPNSKYQRLNNFIATINAESIQVNGNLFTWKKRIDTNLIYERLDRSICVKDCSTIYPKTFETHGNFTCSNLNPIILPSNFQQTCSNLSRTKNYQV